MKISQYIQCYQIKDKLKLFYKEFLQFILNLGIMLGEIDVCGNTLKITAGIEPTNPMLC